jgi:hypothetical protein
LRVATSITGCAPAQKSILPEVMWVALLHQAVATTLLD